MMYTDGYDIAREACPPHHIKFFPLVLQHCHLMLQWCFEFQGPFERMRRKGLSETAGVDSKQNQLFFDVSDVATFRDTHLMNLA